MTTTIHDGKEQFEELVKRASQGEEVLIAVDGHGKARLLPAIESVEERTPGPAEMADWARDLRVRLNDYVTGVVGTSTAQILDELR